MNNNTVFALAEIYDNTTGGICVEVVKTTDGFNQDVTSVAVPVDIDPGIDACDFTRGQAFYDLLIEVDPTDDNNLYLGGINLFRSKNGGASWDQISTGPYISTDAPLVHADQHSMVFRPGYQNEVLFSNDGGVYYSDNILEDDLATLQIDSRNKNLSITQFYFSSMSPISTDEFFVAGAQDNGTIAINGAEEKSEGFEISGGDGGYCFISKDKDPDTPEMRLCDYILCL